MSSPNLLLNLSTPLVTAGPLWASNVEANWLLLDQHDHTNGKGLKITPSGLNINSELQVNSNYISTVKAIKLDSQASSLSTSDLRAVYVVNGDLYYNNGTGSPVQVTSGTSLNVSGVGGISGLTGTTAAVTYFDLTKTFSFTQDAGVTANLDTGPVTVRENVAAANGITIQSPTALAGDYDLTLFAAPPLVTLPVVLDPSGNLSTQQLVGTQLVTGVALQGNTSSTVSFTTPILNTPSIVDVTSVSFTTPLIKLNGSTGLTFSTGRYGTSNQPFTVGTSFLDAYEFQLQNSLSQAASLTLLNFGGTPSVGFTSSDMSLGAPATAGFRFLGSRTIGLGNQSTGSMLPIVVGRSTSTSEGLVLLHANVNSGATFSISSVGMSVAQVAGAGTYDVTFGYTFATNPTVVATLAGEEDFAITVNTLSATSVRIITTRLITSAFGNTVTASRENAAFNLMVMGRRGTT
jgi:hypothetical protein